MSRRVVLIRNTKPENYGGAESYQLMLAKMLKKFGFDCWIISSSNKLLEEAKKQKVHYIRGMYNKRQIWSGVFNLLLPLYFIYLVKLRRYYRKIFNDIKPDVINVQSRDDWIAATWAAKSLNIRVLWTDHMDFRSWVLQNIDIPYKNIIGKILLFFAKKATKIIFISDYEYDYFNSLKSTRKLENTCVIKNGSFDVLASYNSKKCDSKSIAYVGRIIDYKGINELLDAFETASEAVSCRLDIYGEGPALDELKKDNCNPNIIFHGYTERPLDAIAGSKFFVLPSYREGLSLSLLDACMLGRCLIATNVDGNPEIVINEKTGLLVPPKDSPALSKAIIRLVSDKKLADRLSSSARKHYEKNFDFERNFKEKMLSLYE